MYMYIHTSVSILHLHIIYITLSFCYDSYVEHIICSLLSESFPLLTHIYS